MQRPYKVLGRYKMKQDPEVMGGKPCIRGYCAF